MNLEKLVTYQEAQKTTGLSYWQLKRRVANNQLEAVKLPNNQSALTRSSVESYADQTKRKAQSTRPRRPNNDSLADSAVGSV